MTWTRVFQTGLESGHDGGEGNFFDGFANSGVSANTVVSGYYTSDSGAFVTGFMGNDANQMRVGFLAIPENAYIGTIVFFEFFCREATGNAVYMLSAAQNRWMLVYRDPDTGNDTTLATAPIYVDGWNQENCLVAFGVTIKPGASGFLSFYINGRQILTFTGGVLDNALSVIGFTVDRTGFLATSNGLNHFDDVYCDTSDGSEGDAIPPTLRFPFKRVTADGSLNEWTGSAGGDHYQWVNLYPTIDTDYVYTAAAGQTELYVTTPGWTLADYHTIQAVIPMVRAKKGDIQKDSEIEMLLYGPPLSVATAEDLTPGFMFHWARFEEDPNTNPWIEATVQLIEAGFRSAGTL